MWVLVMNCAMKYFFFNSVFFFQKIIKIIEETGYKTEGTCLALSIDKRNVEHLDLYLFYISE